MRFLLFILAFLFITNVSFAQGALSGKDLSTIKVDALTEAEIGQIQQQLKQGGVSIDQVEQQAMAKGMSASEFAKLKARLANAKPTSGNKSPLLKKQSNRRNDSTSKKSDSLDFFNFKPINPLIYGSELFNQNNTGLSSNQNIATPLNYEIGPNDVLKLVVYGVQEYAEDITVSNEGRIQVQNVGPIKVAGLTIEAAIEKIKQQMANTAYPSIARGESKLALTLGDIRTIHVTVIGANQSGVHNVSSLSNILSVLTEAGGPSEIGSYRQIELIRNNKLFKKIDLYQFMQNGDQSQNIGLKDNDVVRVPPYKNRIEIKGQVKRPGIFELIGNENFNQFLQYASGFDDTAYTAWVKIIQKNGKEKAVKDLAKIDFAKYQPQGGDEIFISKILDRYENRVKLSGAIFRPDLYELTPGMRVADLVQRADGLKEDAYTGRAQLIRLKPNLLKELITVNLTKALKNDPTENILLQREDELYISSVLEMRDSLAIDLMGEVKNPGKFNYIDSMTVKDLILLAGGFTYIANKKVEVARQLKFGDKVTNNNVATILQTEINGDLSFNSGNENFILQPLDVVTITKQTGYTQPSIVKITGQVQNTGNFALASRLDRVSDIITRAGGLIDGSSGEFAFIKRKRYELDSLKSDETKANIEKAYVEKFKAQQNARLEEEKQLMAEEIKNGNSNTANTSLTMSTKLNEMQRKNLKDTLNMMYQELQDDVYQIAIDLNEVIKHPGTNSDLILMDGDEIVVPKLDNKVKISGGVLRPTNIVYEEGLTIGDCVSAAGGVSEYSRRNKAYVVYANGKSARMKDFGLFRINPKVKPGSEVVIPETNSRKDKALNVTLQYFTVITQLIAALATVKLLTK
jgi:protein involved in polysaccharide export with SLBB domain